MKAIEAMQKLYKQRTIDKINKIKLKYHRQYFTKSNNFDPLYVSDTWNLGEVIEEQNNRRVMAS